MNSFLKYAGVIIILIGVAIFVVYANTEGGGNGYLWSGLACVIAGLIAHIFLNKYIK